MPVEAQEILEMEVLSLKRDEHGRWYAPVSYTHLKESAPFLRVSGKALHKRSIAILAGMGTAHIGIDRVTAYRQTRLDVYKRQCLNSSFFYFNLL